jgi:hypothetical protein
LSPEEMPVVTGKSLALPALMPLAGHSPGIKGLDGCETVPAVVEGVQSVSDPTTKDYMEAASLESMGQSSGVSPLEANHLPAINSTETPARRQTDGQPTTAVVGDASVRPVQTSSASAVDAVLKSKSNGQLDSHQVSASLLSPRHHSKTPSADETWTRQDPTFSAAEATILDERRLASNQAKEDGSLPYSECLESLKKPVTAWSDRMRRTTALNLDFTELGCRSLGINGSPRAESLAQGNRNPDGPSSRCHTYSFCVPQAEPNPEGFVRYQTSSASAGSKKPRVSQPQWAARGPWKC